jgi:bacterioferritin-associated ferredoxin
MTERCEHFSEIRDIRPAGTGCGGCSEWLMRSAASGITPRP